MRILVITNFFPPHDVGGAEISAFYSSYGLLQQGMQISVLVVNSRMPETRNRHYAIHGLPVRETTFRRNPLDNPLLQTFDPRVYRQVVAELRRLEPDLVHIHNISGASMAPFAACRRLKVPLVLTLHDHWLLCPNNMLYQRDGTLCDPAKPPGGCRRCFQRYDYWADIPMRRTVFASLVQDVRVFISPSQKLVDLHVAAGYDRARFRVVPYGLQPGLFPVEPGPPVRGIIRESGLLRTLMFAGAVVQTKGVQTLVEALPLLRRHVDRIRLIVAGAGEERLMAALRAFDPSIVKLLGRVPFQEVRALYAAADLTIVPSTWYDNSPVVMYESLLAGTPVLGSAIGGIPELIEPDGTGYLVPPGDAVALAEQVILHFAQSTYRRRAMREQCVRYARSHMTLERHIDRLRPVYDEALRA